MLDVWTRPNSADIRILMSDQELVVVEEHASVGHSALQLLYEPRFLASSRPSNRIGKWCISGVSFIVTRCTSVFRNMASWGGCSFNVR